MSTMNVEEMLEHVGGWGRYQKVIYLLACLPSILTAGITVGYSWTAYNMEHRCLVPSCEDGNNASYSADFLRFSTPADADHTWRQCSVFQRSTSIGCQAADFSRETEACSHWVYDTSVMENTLVSEFDLVCEDASSRPLGGSIFFIGKAVGSILTGLASDMLGRKTTLMGAVVLTLIIHSAAAFAPSFAVFTLLRSLAGIFGYAIFTVPFVLSMEMTSTRVRSFCGIAINIFFALGEALLGVYAIFVKDWKILQLICSLPMIVFCSYWFFIPESPRWLVATGKKDEAVKVLRNVAKWNKTTFPEQMAEQEAQVVKGKESPVSSDNFIQAMKTPVLLKRACILTLQWTVATMVYYGISFVSTDFGGDVYLNFILTMLIEIPSYVFCVLAINKLGRKMMVGGSFILSGLGSICAGFAHASAAVWLTTALALLGKFGVASAFALIYLYTAELYPTGLRTQGVGLASCTGRIGAIIAPFIATLGGGSPTIPMCIFGVSALVAGAVTVLLPETTDVDLPTTIADAVSFGRGQSWLPIPCLEARRRRSHERTATSTAPSASTSADGVKPSPHQTSGLSPDTATSVL